VSSCILKVQIWFHSKKPRKHQKFWNSDFPQYSRQQCTSTPRVRCLRNGHFEHGTFVIRKCGPNSLTNSARFQIDQTLPRNVPIFTLKTKTHGHFLRRMASRSIVDADLTKICHYCFSFFTSVCAIYILKFVYVFEF
jgi:hypothetical protein